MSSIVPPSKAGLRTILEVLKIQLEFWPCLKSNYTALQSESKLISSNTSKNALLCIQKTEQKEGTLWNPYGGSGEAKGLFTSYTSKGRGMQKEFIHEDTCINMLLKNSLILRLFSFACLSIKLMELSKK